MHRALSLIIVATVVLAAACGGSTSPAAPAANGAVTTSPAPPAPPLPVRPENVRFVSPPATPPVAADPLVGRYTLDIVVAATSGARCESVPEHAKHRTYTADISDLGDSYAVTLYDARFLADGASVGYGCVDRRLPRTGVCNQFLISRDAGHGLPVIITPEDEWRGSEIWEVLVEDGRLLAITGHATAVASNGRIDAAGTGGIWYGNGLPAAEFAGCGQGDIRLTFARR